VLMSAIPGSPLPENGDAGSAPASLAV
jgi:hypothetical protein